MAESVAVGPGSGDTTQGGSRLATAKSELLSNASAVSAQPPSVPRGRRASYAMGEQQSRIWTQGFTGNSSMLQQRVQPPGVNASYGASRYSRVGVAGGSGGMTARPPMRRSKSSMLQLNNSAGNRYGNAVPSQNFQLDTATQVRQGYPNVRQNPRQISNASLFSRGAGAPTQRFIPATESSVSEEAGDDDVFMTRSFKEELPTLQIYAKQLQHPRNGIPSVEQMVMGVKTRVFKGSDAAEWLMLSADGVHTAAQAQELGQKLLNLGIIAPVEEGSQVFKVSSKACFYFCHPSNFSGADAASKVPPSKVPPRPPAPTKKPSSICIVL